MDDFFPEPKPIDIGRAADSKEPKHDSFVMFCQS